MWRKGKDTASRYVTMAVVFGLIGTWLLVSTHAATPAASVDAATGTTSNCAGKVGDSTTNGQSAVKFGACVTDPNATPFAQGTFLNQDETLVPGYESWIGHSIPLVEEFGARNGESTLTCPSYVMDPATAAGKTIIISWDFFDSDKTNNGGPAPGMTWEPSWGGAPYGDTGETWNSAAVGSNMTSDGVTWDQRYKAFGQCLMAHGQPNAIIRVDTEFNNQSNGLTADQMVTTSNTTETGYFKQAFATFVNDMRSIPGSNFTFDWNPSADPGNGGLDPSGAYPGDQYVDVIGVDLYESSCPWGNNYPGDAANWSCQYNGQNGGWGLSHYLSFAQQHNKPLSFPEWGIGWYYSNNGAQQVPADSESYYIQQMWNFMDNPANRVMYESFWEDSGAGLYHNPGASMPNTTATFKATFGSKKSAGWPVGTSGGSSGGGSSGSSSSAVTIPFRLAAGSTSGFTDSNGHAWSADQYYTDYSDSGGGINTGTNVTGTSSTPAQVFQQGHWGVQNYHIPIANGTYNINLDFAELNATAGPGRTFGVTVEGSTTVEPTSFNIETAAGGAMKGYTKSVTAVTVSDGYLDITFPRGSDAPLISGIEITNG